MNHTEADLVLIDTSVWVQYFNLPGSEEHSQVRDLMLRSLAAVTGVVVAEVLHGARSAEHLSELANIMNASHFLETTREAWTAVGELAYTLKVRGESVPMPDLVIGAVALENGCSIFTRDRAFQRIPGLLLYAPEGA